MGVAKRAGRLLVAAGAVGAVFFVIARLGSRGASELPFADVQDPALADPQTMTAAVRLARAHVLGEDAPVPEVLDRIAGRATSVCAYGLPGPASCALGEGSTLGEAVVAAADAVAALPPSWDVAARRIRIKLDVVQHREAVTWPGDELPRALGLDGYLDPDGGGFLTASEALERGLQGDDHRIPTEAMARALGLRGPTPTGERLALERFRASSWVEARPGGEVLRILRLHAFERPDAGDPEVLLQAAVLAADHLASSVSDEGRIRYVYDPVEDRIPGGYNRLRHAGTTYSLIQAWDRVRVPAWRAAAEAAIGWLLTQSRRDERRGPWGGGEVQYVVESSHIKLGGAGLALVMLATWQAATGDDTYAEDARAFARFLVSQQQQTGEFVYFANKDPGGEPRDDTSAYYPGEAILGLMLWHRLDPDPLWLDTAVRGADWLIDVRDAGKGPTTLANDHWLMIALSHLYRVTGDERYVDHSLALVDAVQWQADRTAASAHLYPDYAGGYYDPPRSTPAATRAEGLVAVLDTCELSGQRCDHVRELLVDTVSHVLQSQYTPAVSWWVSDPAVPLGGFAGGLVDPTLRNDYTQHAMSAVLGAERHLRTDRKLPGAPGWTPDDSAAFPGVPSPVTRSLRAVTRAVRGPTLWDLRVASAPDRGTTEGPSGPPE